MKLAQFTLHRVRIPFKIKFGHAAAMRECSDSVVVLLRSQEGVTGMGECAPREYVTGETAESVFAELRSAGPALGNTLEATEDPVALLRDELPERMRGNAARCAVELAALDLLGKCAGKSLPDLIAKPVVQTAPRYSSVIGSDSTRGTAVSALKMRIYGFQDVKIKVGISPERDVKTAKTARFVLGKGIDIRADANGVWSLDEAERTLAELAPFGLSCIEQPLAKDRNDDLPELRRRVGLPVMLDESLCTMDDATRSVEQGQCDLFNIRISKCGGLLSSLRMADYAAEHGIGCQLGCQVGETGILSAAGRIFSTLVSDLLHLEGSYERHLLADDITRERVRFGYGGRAEPMQGHGLGVSLDAEALSRYAEDTAEIEM